MIETRATQRYAKAILEIAVEQNDLDRVVEDFKTLDSAISGSDDLRLLLLKPTIQAETKAKLLESIFGDKLGEIVRRFVHLVVKKGRSGDMPGIVQSFWKALNRHRGVVAAEVVSSVELSEENRQKIEDRLVKLTGKEVDPHFHIDPDLIGGFTARVDDQMIDASIKHQLERLKESLAEGASAWTPVL